jgi:hypothetical protein
MSSAMNWSIVLIGYGSRCAASSSCWGWSRKGARHAPAHAPLATRRCARVRLRASRSKAATVSGQQERCCEVLSQVSGHP